MSSEVEMRSQSRRRAQRLNELQDEEQSSLLLDEGGDPRDGGPSSSPSRPPSSLPKDLVVCNAAWNGLSRPMRSTLLLVAGALLAFATYEFGADVGARKQERENADSAADYPSKSWRAFTGDDGDGEGDDEKSGTAEDSVEREREEPHREPEGEGEGEFHPTFRKEILVNTRARAQHLIGELHDYYGGEERAKAMLVQSWQAQWQLDGDYVFWDGSEDQNYDDGDDHDENVSDADDRGGGDNEANDDDENGASDAGVNDGGDDTERPLTAREKHKLAKKEAKAREEEQRNGAKEGDSIDDPENASTEESKQEQMKKDAGAKRKMRKEKKPLEEGKVIDDPDSMSTEELERHHHRRRQRTAKLVATMARALLDPARDRFVVGTIGSSVAAGHDNCHYDSYESQLERTLTPVFAAANMHFVAQNAGEGGGCGDNHKNQVFCITHNVSPDVDVVHYSWTYMEKDAPEVQREQLVRWAQRMERRPMVHHFNARGKKNTCGGDVRANVDLDKTYAVYGYNAFCIQTGLYFGGHDYDAEVAEGLNRFGWKKQGDGYHNTTRYGEELPDDDPRKGSLGTVYRNWHPGPLGFQIVADAFAYVYTTGLLMALDIIEEDMNAGVDIMDRWFDTDVRRRRLGSTSEEENDGNSQTLGATFSSPSEPLVHRQLQKPLLPPLGNMPEPLFCDPVYCSTPHPPSCLNYEKPTFGSPGITVPSQAKWLITNDFHKWNNMVGKVDTAIFKAKHDKEWEHKCAHLDACGGIHASDSTQGTLTFELPTSKMTAGLVFVCGCCGKNIAESMFIQNQNVTFKLNDRVLDKSKMDVYPNKKCVRLLKAFGHDDGYEKEDTMLLKLEMADQDPDMAYELKPFVKVSHVVAL